MERYCKLAISIIFLLILLFSCGKLFAQAYSRQDIVSLIDYFKDYDAKTRVLIIAEESRLDELVNQSYEDIKTYKEKKALKKFVEGLYDNLLAMCNSLTKQTDSASVRKGFYDPNSVSVGFNKLNLEAAYLLLRIKILGYLYQYRYNEMALNKDILCPFFYIYSTANKVKSCNAP